MSQLDELEAERKTVSALKQLKQQGDNGPDLWSSINERIQCLTESESISSAQTPPATHWYQRWQSLAAVWLVTLTLFLSGGWLLWKNSDQAAISGETIVAGDESAKQIDALDKSWHLARAALIAQLKNNQNKLAPETLSNIESNLLIIEQATSELTGLLKKHPNDPKLQHLLQQTRQKELVFLRQLNLALSES